MKQKQRHSPIIRDELTLPINSNVSQIIVIPIPAFPLPIPSNYYRHHHHLLRRTDNLPDKVIISRYWRGVIWALFRWIHQVQTEVADQITLLLPKENKMADDCRRVAQQPAVSESSKVVSSSVHESFRLLFTSERVYCHT